jgi:hypothetical protein
VTPDDAEYLNYAARSIDYVFEDTSHGREHFFRDRRSREAVLYRLHTIHLPLLKPQVARMLAEL